MGVDAHQPADLIRHDRRRCIVRQALQPRYRLLQGSALLPIGARACRAAPTPTGESDGNSPDGSL